MRSFDLIIFSHMWVVLCFHSSQTAGRKIAENKTSWDQIFWVSQPPFAQPSPVDPQVKNPFVSAISEPLAQAKPQPADPTIGEALQLNSTFRHFHIQPNNSSLQGRPSCCWTLLAPGTRGKHCQALWYC